MFPSQIFMTRHCPPHYLCPSHRWSHNHNLTNLWLKCDTQVKKNIVSKNNTKLNGLSWFINASHLGKGTTYPLCEGCHYFFLISRLSQVSITQIFTSKCQWVPLLNQHYPNTFSWGTAFQDESLSEVQHG